MITPPVSNSEYPIESIRSSSNTTSIASEIIDESDKEEINDVKKYATDIKSNFNGILNDIRKNNTDLIDQTTGLPILPDKDSIDLTIISQLSRVRKYFLKICLYKIIIYFNQIKLKISDNNLIILIDKACDQLQYMHDSIPPLDTSNTIKQKLTSIKNRIFDSFSKIRSRVRSGGTRKIYGGGENEDLVARVLGLLLMVGFIIGMGMLCVTTLPVCVCILAGLACLDSFGPISITRNKTKGGSVFIARINKKNITHKKTKKRLCKYKVAMKKK